VQQLHQKLSYQPIPSLSNELNSEEHVEMQIVSCCASLRTGLAVTEELFRYLKSKEVQITGLRTTVFYRLNDDWPIPVIEWTENDREVLALFTVDEESGVCSSLVHYGSGRLDSTSAQRWENSAVTWGAVDTDHLKTLFSAAQSLLGVLEWSVDDILNLYCKSDPSDASKET
jgi:hypothetical protein